MGANRETYPKAVARNVLACVLLVALVLSAGTATSRSTAASAAFVRINQVGFEADAPKRAYLLASGSEAGAIFTVKRADGDTVFSAPIGRQLGAWSAAFPFVYALDFGDVSSPGTYSISVHGAISASSLSFKVNTPANLYSPLLSNALFFYQAQRDGRNVISSVMNRRPSHLHDESALTYARPKFDSDGALMGDLVRVGGPVNVSGGWFDAGDYVKFVETHSYVVSLLSVALRDHPSLLGPGSRANIAPEVKFGLDWLQKMWDDDTRTLYYQVAIGDGNSEIAGDHDLWRLPEVDDTFGGTDQEFKFIRHRPALRSGRPGSSISPNLAGRLAAAFALGFQVFRETDRTLANNCLISAEHIFDLANTSPRGQLLTVSPFDFYPETEWRDDLELGAAELYFATAEGDLPRGLPHSDPLFYLRRAAKWARAYIDGPNDGSDTLNLFDVSSLGHYELHRGITDARWPYGLDVTQEELVADIKGQLDGAFAQSRTDPFGFGFPYDEFDGTSHGQGLAIMASMYDELTGTTTFAGFGRRQLGVLLGSNAWGASFIVGAGTAFPNCPHHQIANLTGSLDGSRPILKGAPVNGTNSPDLFTDLELPDGARVCPPGGGDAFAPFSGMGAAFLDNVISWPTVEPAIDFAATTPLAFARRIAGLR